MWWRKLCEVENEYTSHNFSLFAIFLPKIIKIGEHLTKFWQKQFCTVFLRHGVSRVAKYFAVDVYYFTVYTVGLNTVTECIVLNSSDL